MALNWLRPGRSRPKRQIRWQVNPANPGLIQAARGPYFQQSAISDAKQYAEDFRQIGIAYRSMLHGHLSVVGKFTEHSAAEDRDQMFNAGEDYLVAAARLGSFGGDRWLIQQLQQAVHRCRQFIVRDLPGLLSGTLAYDDAHLEMLTDQLFAIDEDLERACAIFPGRHLGEQCPTFSRPRRVPRSRGPHRLR